MGLTWEPVRRKDVGAFPEPPLPLRGLRCWPPFILVFFFFFFLRTGGAAFSIYERQNFQGYYFCACEHRLSRLSGRFPGMARNSWCASLGPSRSLLRLCGSVFSRSTLGSKYLC